MKYVLQIKQNQQLKTIIRRRKPETQKLKKQNTSKSFNTSATCTKKHVKQKPQISKPNEGTIASQPNCQKAKIFKRLYYIIKLTF
jgi:hypothetical protein